MYLQGFWSKSVYLKCIWIQLKSLYLRGPHSSRPCISRPCCNSKFITLTASKMIQFRKNIRSLFLRLVNITTKLSALWQWCSAVHFLRELLHQQMKIEWWSHIKVTIFPSQRWPASYAEAMHSGRKGLKIYTVVTGLQSTVFIILDLSYLRPLFETMTKATNCIQAWSLLENIF